MPFKCHIPTGLTDLYNHSVHFLKMEPQSWKNRLSLSQSSFSVDTFDTSKYKIMPKLATYGNMGVLVRVHEEERRTSEWAGLNSAAGFLSFANLSVLPWKSSAACNHCHNPFPKDFKCTSLCMLAHGVNADVSSVYNIWEHACEVCVCNHVSKICCVFKRVSLTSCTGQRK